MDPFCKIDKNKHFDLASKELNLPDSDPLRLRLDNTLNGSNMKAYNMRIKIFTFELSKIIMAAETFLGTFFNVLFI